MTECGDNALYSNMGIYQLNLPNLISIGEKFLYLNNVITVLKMPKLLKAKKPFLCHAYNLVKLEVPNLEGLKKSFPPEMHERLLRQIESEDIIRLDKKSQMTTIELKLAGRELENLLKTEEQQK